MNIQCLFRKQFRLAAERQNIARTLCVPAVVAAALGCSFGALATSDKASAYYEDALKRYDRNEIPAAVIQLKNAIQQDSKMLAAHLLLGKALLKNGDLKGAEAAFEEAIKQGVNRGEVALPLGQVYLALGRPEAVIEKISASGLSPSLQVDVLTMRANAYFETGKASLAAQSLENAKAIDPKSASPLIAEVPMLLAAGRLDQAKEKAAKAVELAPNSAFSWNVKASVLHASFDAPGALAAYDKALALNPKHLDARVARAALLIDLKRDGDAKKDLDYLKETAEDEPRAAYLRSVLAGQKGDAKAVSEALSEVTRTIDALPPAWLARREQLLMAAALSHYGLGNHQKAREYLDVINSHSPNNLGAKKLLASIYIETKDYGRAQPLLESLQRVLPEDPQVMFMLGSVHLAQRRFAQASQLLDKAASRTGSSNMNRSLGFSQLGQGQTDLGLSSLEKAYAANPADMRAGTALATLYSRLGKTEKALKIADSMVKRDPSNLTALNFLGSLKRANGDNSGARAAYAQVLTKDPAFAPAVLNLSRIEVGEGRFDQARQRLDGLLKKNANDAQVLFEYGLLEQRAGRGIEAIRYLAKATTVQRVDPNPGLLLIDLYLTQRQADQALAVAKELAGKFSTNLKVQLALARAHLANGAASDARTILTAATRLAEFDSGAQVAIARLQLVAANPEGAAYSVYKALQGSPDDIAALALAVQIEARRGDSAKAEAALRVLSTKYPSAIETVRAGADLAMARGQFTSAITGYQKMFSRDETTANALLVAEAYIAAGEASKAAAFLDAWVKKHPGDRGAQRVLAETQFRSGQLVVARQTYQRVIAANPDDAMSLNNFANLLLQLNDPTAQEFAERAVKIAPASAEYADTLGWILVGKGRTDAGLRYLREARLRSPENGEIRFHLAFTLAKIGRKEEARDELRVALNGSGYFQGNEQLVALRRELGL